MPKTSEAQLKANAKHLASLDEFKVRVPKGKKDEYKAQAAAHGMSLNAYIIKLLEADKPQE
ncbi:MAG: toxin-antitoxin system HicB family antitoxin [Oscillospiraceae bacterium]|nr:toxin-antitoxin system HicB family antitoxin [Oscillospiraceae bacterium]